MILYTVSVSLFNSKTIVHIACFIPCWKLEYQNIKDRLLRGRVQLHPVTLAKKKNEITNCELISVMKILKFPGISTYIYKYMKPGHFKLPAPKTGGKYRGQSLSFLALGPWAGHVTLWFLFLKWAYEYLHWNRFNVYLVRDITHMKHP